MSAGPRTLAELVRSAMVGLAVVVALTCSGETFGSILVVEPVEVALASIDGGAGPARQVAQEERDPQYWQYALAPQPAESSSSPVGTGSGHPPDGGARGALSLDIAVVAESDEADLGRVAAALLLTLPQPLEHRLFRPPRRQPVMG